MSAPIVFLIACLASLAVAPGIRKLAWATGFVDKPDENRKVQSRPVAFGGGLIVSFGLFVSLVFLTTGLPGRLGGAHHQIEWSQFFTSGNSVFGLVIASGIVVGIGCIDDRFGMRGRHKLFWQVVASIIAVGSSQLISAVDLFGSEIQVGVFGFAFTVIWVLGSINAFNLIDGVDGLAGTVGFIISLALGIISLLRSDLTDAMLAFAMAGSLLGFLYFNWAPASIYLGDAGSMLIGLILGSIALRCSIKEFATVAAAPILAIWSILIFDSIAAVMRRKLTGRSIYDCDRGHIHHRLQSKGLSAEQTSLIVGSLCTVTSMGAIASVYYGRPNMGLAISCVTVAILILTRIFGHVEATLAGKRLLQFGRNSIQPLQRAPEARSDTTRLQGDVKWEQVWQSIIEVAEKYELSRVRLNLHIARNHEDFFASWESELARKSADTSTDWTIVRPIVFREMGYGRIVAEGPQNQFGTDSQVKFIEFAEHIEIEIHELAFGSSDIPIESKDLRSDFKATDNHYAKIT